jgi:PAS domain S-box-containing protein
MRAAFDRSQHAVLLADDQRRWVAGNAAACALLGIEHDTVPWHTMDDFTPLSERARLKEQWQGFLDSGEAEGRYELYVANRDPFPVEFSAIAHVMPSRHLALFIPPEADGGLSRDRTWKPRVGAAAGRLPLSTREREVMTMAASGSQSADMAALLYLSQETIKSHVQNAMSKLGAHTRAHAVAIALVTGQISWSDELPPSG